MEGYLENHLRVYEFSEGNLENSLRVYEFIHPNLMGLFN